MAEIIPFRALRYDPHRIPDLAQVVTPPYDIISPEAQDRYYARHPQSVVRLVLAKSETQGGPGASRYAQAAATYAAWRRDGILRRDPTPTIYLYEQEFSAGQTSRLRRRGLLALVRLHEYAERVILPHERTFSRHKDDRLQLMRACPANLEAILGFYPGANQAIGALLDRYMNTKPAVRLVDEEGIGHRLWQVAAPPDVVTLCAALRDRPVVIADGHHRYETALTFRNERRSQDPTPAAAAGHRLDDFVLMNLVSSDDPGLVILPTHRVIRRPPARRGAALAEALAGHFRIVVFPLDAGNPLPSLQAALADLARRAGTGVACALYTGGREILVMELTDPTVPRAFLAEGRAAAYAELDVAVLHRLLVEEILGIPQATQTDDTIQYTRDASCALATVRSGEAAAALFLNPPRVDQVQAIAMVGERMPQKSTFFYPKVLSGLVMSPLDEEG
ncbi:MAG TPA: DUF1015 domain-containing protein [Vicinamibacteria bacterium]